VMVMRVRVKSGLQTNGSILYIRNTVFTHYAAVQKVT
jgi:hypothetical protein